MTSITTYAPKFIEASTATSIYDFLKKEINWVDSVRSRFYGLTRKGKPINHNKAGVITDIINGLIETALAYLKSKNVAIGDYDLSDGSGSYVYLNHYRSGQDWAPNHKHDKPFPTDQLIISLGATRTLNLEKIGYQMGNGDVIIFGYDVKHGVPKQPAINDGRISIAAFMVPKQGIPMGLKIGKEELILMQLKALMASPAYKAVVQAKLKTKSQVETEPKTKLHAETEPKIKIPIKTKSQTETEPKIKIPIAMKSMVKVQPN